MKNPCVKDCPRRSQTCHGDCPDYAGFAKWCEEMRRKRREDGEKWNTSNPGKESLQRRRQRYEKAKGKKY